MTIKPEDVNAEAGEGVEVTVEPTHPPKKPDYDPMEVMRTQAQVEQSIRDKEAAARTQEEKRGEFQTWIRRHEEWEAGDQQGDKPMYNRQALQDGIMDINQNIRRIRESIETERQNMKRLDHMLESYQKYQRHLEEQAAQEE